MTMWILAIVLLAALSAFGSRQGGIRVAFSFVGIVMGALLAAPLGHLLRPLLELAQLKNPILLWALPPVVVFILFSIVFKSAGLAVHKKADNYYKYKASDSERIVWERLQQRLGLCLGLANGTAYLILISFVIYSLTYWTVQISNGESDPAIVKFANRLGSDCVRSGMARVARSVDRLPVSFYDAADVTGLLYHNPLLIARVSHYPGFLALGERPEFQELGDDLDFTGGWQTQKSFAELIRDPKVQAILKNRELTDAVWEALVKDMADFRSFLETAQSAKYDTEKILGRWIYDARLAIALVRKSKPNLNPQERRWLTMEFAKATFMAAPNQDAALKHVPHVKPGTPPTIEQQDYRGQWKKSGNDYTVTLTMDGKTQDFDANVDTDRMTLSGAGLEMAFVREEY